MIIIDYTKDLDQWTYYDCKIEGLKILSKTPIKTHIGCERRFNIFKELIAVPSNKAWITRNEEDAYGYLELPCLWQGYVFGETPNVTHSLCEEGQDFVLFANPIESKNRRIVTHQISNYFFDKNEAIEQYTKDVADHLNSLKKEQFEWIKKLLSTVKVHGGNFCYHLIKLSNIELKRLNWSVQQAREYTLRTYGKRSRQVLSEEELIDFYVFLREFK
ncbi:MAG: hypothetical protein QNJ33_11830 [Crocosphaera sp.]|nr:hypothetical protein [Crocosphaera sp.]